MKVPARTFALRNSTPSRRPFGTLLDFATSVAFLITHIHQQAATSSALTR